MRAPQRLSCFLALRLPLPIFVFTQTLLLAGLAATPSPQLASFKAHKLRRQLEDLRVAVSDVMSGASAENDGLGYWNPRLSEGDRTIERRPHSDAFTAKQFHDQYESKGRPVIISSPVPFPRSRLPAPT